MSSILVYNVFTNNLDYTGTGNTVGPGVSTVGDIVIWTNTTGTGLGDSGVAFPIPVASGGTGDTSFTPYAVITGGTTSTGTLQDLGALGSSGQVLTSNGAGALPSWQTNAGGDVSGPGSSTNNDIVLFNGTTGKLIKDSGVSLGTVTNHAVLIGGSNTITSISVGATGAVLMGSTGADPAFTTTPTIAGNTTISGSLTMNGGMIQKRTATAISYTVLVTDVIIAVTDTTAARTITMPNSGLVAGQRWTIKDESGGAATHAITISGNGANVDGAASQVMNTNYGSVDIYCNGTNFFLV